MGMEDKIKYFFLLNFLFFSFLTFGQETEELPPKFLDPKKDTSAFINCRADLLDTLIISAIQNPKFVIDHDIRCSASIVFTIKNNFVIRVNTYKEEDVILNIVFKDKVSKKYADEIRKFYVDQTRKIAMSLYGILIPDRVNGEYLSTKYYLKIDYNKSLSVDTKDSVVSEKFDPSELSSLTVSKNKKLREKGIEMLKNRNPKLALIYFRMAYFIANDIEAVVLLGNLWNAMGEKEAACHHWKIAAEKNNTQAQEFIKNCK